MKNTINLFFIIITFLSCNQNKSKNKVSNYSQSNISISKIEISEFDASPKDYNLLKYSCVNFENNVTQVIEYTYVKGTVKDRKIIKSIENSGNTKIFDSIPKKYLENNMTFGNPNAVDEGGINIKIFLSNNKIITWVLSYEESLYPNEIKELIQKYKSIVK